MAVNLIGQSDNADSAGVLGEGVTSDVSEGGTGVYGRDRAGKGNGVIGSSAEGRGVWGHSNTGHGVVGESVNGRGLVGTSQTDYGIRGHSNQSAGIRGSSDAGRGVEGWATNSDGVVGISTNGNGIMGQTEGAGIGVIGRSKSGVGLWGVSEVHEGVHAETHSSVTAAMAAYQMNADSGSAAFFAKHWGNRTAGRFEGDIEVTGVINMTRGDYAEDFTVASPEDVEPGMVMVLDDAGGVRVSQEAYDRRVAGVVSGAGSYKPAVILDHDAALPNRLPLALMGKVFCMVDATDAPVGIGDLLTTSSVPGHAMKAADPLKAFGSVIGKALQPLASGRGLVPILVRFQ